MEAHCCGLPVISVQELRRKHKKSLILVTIGAHAGDVKRQLVENGFDGYRILTISNQEALCYYTHIPQWYWPEKDLLLHKDELSEVYNLLSDQKSRQLFVSRIALFVGGADFKSFQHFISTLSEVPHDQGTDFHVYMNYSNCSAEVHLQFNNDLIKLDNSEVLIDGGAYTGDSTLEFIDACSRLGLTYHKIICFEPDPHIFNELQKNTAQYRNVVLRPLGLWSSPTAISFAGSNIVAPGMTRILAGNGDRTECLPDAMEIYTASIDEDLHDEYVTLIKLDVEGAEFEALRGAMNTIKKYRPKLIISVYHKRNDLFEIPLFINKMVPDYKFYFRHFSRNFGETMLFAIP
jgi:FkbM family methyltransferase